MLKINNNWEFTPEWSDEFLRFETAAEPVRLPHNVGTQMLHYSSPADFTGLVGYRTRLHIPEEYRGRRLFLQFDGAAHIATLYCNNQVIAGHNTGYTAFRAEITSFVDYGADNEIAVRLDTTENPSTPPFGFVIDYLTYGGLYRDAWLDVRPKNYLEDVFLYTPDTDKAHIALLVARIRGLDGLSKNEAEEGILRTAASLRQNFRSVDLICRLRKDEFAVLVTRVDRSLESLIREKMEQVCRELPDGLTLAVGGAFSDRDDPRGDLLQDADAALERLLARSGEGFEFF